MGIRIAVVVMSTSFLLGILMTHWIADSLTLWKSPLTDAHLFTAATYYGLLAKMNVYMAATIVGIVTLGFMALVLSFQDGEVGNLMFDGASIFLYGIASAVYVYSAIPKLSSFTNLLFPSTATRFPTSLRQPTVELASSHLICAVALTGVMILQTAKYWADAEEDDGALETRVPSSQTEWKRSPRPIVDVVEERPAAGNRRGSLSASAGSERLTRSRTSESPSSRRRSPVKRKAGSGSGSATR
ncbi:hypothetical protein M408DRAFT_66726 [Serendipita vermifera MAFF 305830]|uniref:Shr3 amino acid permease chaperone n=1 Tax=Serendipita vermifera MAFF 305830 TaxID=933852 RepID=A0A0C2WVI5_SERVB|nr:hypothetical protein M408DRAFT_66726 [Serendipita vermifera MAFF 305830]